jgi:hypothetical protein
MKRGRLVVAAVLGILAVGCSSITGTDEMDQFTWSLRVNPESVVDGVEATSALRLLHIQGRVRTPSRCDDLKGDYGRSGNQLTLRVTAVPGSGTNCEAEPGGFQYHAVIDGLGRKTYQLRVIHEAYGEQSREFDLQVSVID